ncbi:hypothetical protein BH18ACT1_BH18ACT1_02190 [soil metagenome]
MPSRRWRSAAAKDRFGSSRRHRKRARRRRLLLGLGLLVIVWLAACTALLLTAASDARAAQRRLSGLEGELDAAGLLRGQGEEELAGAAADLRDAADRSSFPLIGPIEVMPVVGRQVRSLQGLTESSASVLELGVEALEDAQRSLEGDLPTGPDRVEVLRALEANTASTIQGVFSAIAEQGPSEGLIEPLREARLEINGELDEAIELLTRTQLVANALRSMLEGDGRYLVLGANNAEMQAGWGMPLQAGVLTVSDGVIDLPDLEPTSDLLLDQGPPLPADLAANWGSLEPNREWRNLALSPRFPDSAPLAAAMWEATGGGPVDGVLALDPYLLEAVLAATGPVVAEGDPVSADSVVPFVLPDPYINESIDEPGRAERQDRLSDVAAAATDALSKDVDAVTLAEQLIEAANGRHLLAWSKVPEEQAGWESAGLDGELDSNSMLVGLVNRGCNKLDWFIDVAASFDVETVAGEREGVLRVAVQNSTPPGESSYIAGPQPDCGVRAAGDWLGVVSASLPGVVGAARVEKGDVAVDGEDGRTRVVASNLVVPRGQRVERVIRFELPLSVRRVRVEPDARPRSIAWRAAGRTWQDGEGRTITLPPDAR